MNELIRVFSFESWVAILHDYKDKKLCIDKVILNISTGKNYT